MLFNATQEEELRVAMVDGQRLYDLNIEVPASERKKANIYKGKITRVEPSLEAAFVNYGADRHGFLPLKEISPEYFVAESAGGGKPNIREVLKEGQDIVVQIDKEERGNKGAALTTYVSLAGRFIVLKPNKSRSGGVSRRIVGEDRDLARQSLKAVNVPDGMSVILRTAGIDRSAEELEWDLNNLLAIWEAIKTVVVQRPSPFLIYRESDSVVRALRDYLTNEIGEILVDDQKAYDQAKEFIEQVMPHNLRKLKHYVDPVPLFTRYQIESQIESAFAHYVTLPSGGSMVIDHTEALVSIDINSARATKGGDIEATALQTNLEAADEIGRQLRLRDLGGLIVIDFIDMGPQKHQREVEARLREAVRQDRARVQIGKISRFGLLEMSRQRLRPSLGESSYLTCPRCSGVGTIRSVESLALAILRLIGEEARKERTAKVIAQLPVEVATYLLNEKRDWVRNVEERHKTQVIMVANPGLETPHYVVRRVRDDQVDLPENVGSSYALTEAQEEPLIPQAIQEKPPAEIPAVASTVKTTPPPKPQTVAAPEPKKPGLISRIIGLFAPAEQEEEPARGRSRGQKQDGRSRGAQRGRHGGDAKGGEPARQSRSKQTKRKRTRKPDEEKAAKPAGEARPAKKKRSKKKKVAAEPRDTQQAATGDEQAVEERSSTGRRRSRGGRRRRRSKDSAEATGADASKDTSGTEAQESKPDEAAKPRAKHSKGAPSADSKPEATDSGSGSTSRDKADSGTAEAASGGAAVAAVVAASTPSKPESVAEPGPPEPATQADASGGAKRTAAAVEKAAPDEAPVEVRSAALEATSSVPRAAQEGAQGNGGDGEPKPTPAAPKDVPEQAEERPRTRLLPWEPQPTSADAAENPADES
jgi:ribonuclease E